MAGNRTFEKKITIDLAKKTAPRGFAGWIWWNRYFIYAGIGVLLALGVLISLGMYARKKAKKRRKRTKRVVKSKRNAAKLKIKKKQKEKAYLFFLALVVVVVLVLIADTYDLFGYVKDFFVVYSNFILLGVGLAVLLILFLKYYRPVIDFLKEKDNEKKP